MTTRGRPGLRSVLASSGYRRLFAAQTISRWGDTVNTVAVVVLVFRLTGSGAGVSGAVIAEIVPVLLAPVAGAVVDRLPRIRVMVAADLWRTALAAVLPLVDHHLAAVYAIAFGLSAGTGVLQSRLRVGAAGHRGRRRADRRQQRPVVGCGHLPDRARPGGGRDGRRVRRGPGVLGQRCQLRRVRGHPCPAPPRRAAPPAATGSWAGHIRDGARMLIAGRLLLRLLAAVQLLAALSAGATSALLVILAERHLRAGPGGFGLLLGAIGGGAALGPCCSPG